MAAILTRTPAVQLRTRDPVADFLRPFRLPTTLEQAVAHVLRQLPADVRRDLMGDGQLCLTTYERGLPMAVPLGTLAAGRPARAVALRRSAADRPAAFLHWLVAHELAHAYLRNDGRQPGEDPEVAADALAEAWGFPRPPRDGKIA